MVKRDDYLSRVDAKLNVASRLVETGVGIQTHNLPFPAPGTYFMKLFFNGEPSDTDIRLQVVKMQVKSG